MARSDKAKADLFARHLSAVFKPHSQPNATKEDVTCHSDENTLIDKLVTIPEFSFGALLKMIAKRKNKKAPGSDLITGLLLKKLPDKAIHKLVEIFNAVIRLEYIPKQFKEAIIILFHKKDKPCTQPSSYRPISLLSTIDKLFERLYIERLLKGANAKKVIPPH